jgi:hypothetical protein
VRQPTNRAGWPTRSTSRTGPSQPIRPETAQPARPAQPPVTEPRVPHVRWVSSASRAAVLPAGMRTIGRSGVGTGEAGRCARLRGFGQWSWRRWGPAVVIVARDEVLGYPRSRRDHGLSGVWRPAGQVGYARSRRVRIREVGAGGSARLRSAGLCPSSRVDTNGCCRPDLFRPGERAPAGPHTTGCPREQHVHAPPSHASHPQAGHAWACLRRRRPRTTRFAGTLGMRPSVRRRPHTPGRAIRVATAWRGQ